MDLPCYEVYALRYATRDARRPEHFVGGDLHDTAMPMDYFTWAVRGGGRTIVVDTGFTAETAARRRRTHLRCPTEALSMLGISSRTVSDVVITHLHYDHVGNFVHFPNARFYLQETEMAYATGRHMSYPFFSHGFDVDDVIGMVRLAYEGRIHWLTGAAEIAPGITLHHAPGHTAGLQVVRIHTRRGWLVLASDASHYWENIRSKRPFTVALDLGSVVDSFRLVERLASSPDHIIPGHDPLVMRLYRAPGGELDGIAVQLHEVPLEPVPVGGFA